jgi:hypothetical protein
MNDWYLFTNQIVGIFERVKIRGLHCEWNMNIVWFLEEGDDKMYSHHSCNDSFRKMEGKEILNEEKKSKRKKCVNVVMCSFYLIFIHFCPTYFLEW